MFVRIPTAFGSKKNTGHSKLNVEHKYNYCNEIGKIK